MDYGSGDLSTADQGGVLLVGRVGRRSVCGRRLSLQPIGCTSAACDMNSAAAAAVCGLWHYTSVIRLCLCVYRFAVNKVVHKFTSFGQVAITNDVMRVITGLMHLMIICKKKKDTAKQTYEQLLFTVE